MICKKHFLSLALITLTLQGCSSDVTSSSASGATMHTTSGAINFSSVGSGKDMSSTGSLSIVSSSESTRKAVSDIPILMYHYIENHDDKKYPVWSNLFISPAIFDRQLQWLQDHGYQTVNLDQMEEIFHGKISGPKKPIVLTFDCGWEDNYTTAMPLLQKHHMIGVFYLITGFLNTKGFLTDDQVRQMAHNGMLIAAHTISHPDLTMIPLKDVEYQLSKSKETLEKVIGTQVVHLAYPTGRYDATVIAVAKSLGYVTATTTHVRFATPQDAPMALPRIRMTSSTTMASVFP